MCGNKSFAFVFGEGYVDVLAASEKTLSGYVDYGQGEIMDCLGGCYRDLPNGIFETFGESRPNL